MKYKYFILISILVLLFLVIIFIFNNKTTIIEGNILVVGDDYLLVSTDDDIDYIINTKNIDYIVGDKVRIEIKNINKNKVPYEANVKNIIIITDNSTEENDHIENEKVELKDDNVVESTVEDDSQETKYSDNDIVTYFSDLKDKVINYNNENDVGREIKEKFVTCVDFLFYDKQIGGKTFKELNDSAKIKVLELAMFIDSKIDLVFPGYKDSISSSYQNIKGKIITLYLDTTTTICNNDSNLCDTAKEGFQDLKENFGITWDLVKNLAGTGLTKLKDWYEIWRYN